MELLRFSTAGNVDDGKSTLIGRLLYDSKSILEDQLEALERSSDLTGGGSLNLANLTDGLKAEREQGITIDVAYRYFCTGRRKFIVADTPGHFQYTRNMVTGASNSQVAIVLIDARNGVTEQTRRHVFISALLRVPQLVVCINKMDLVEYSKDRFEQIRENVLELLKTIEFRGVTFIPVSALVGDNIVHRSDRMPWYQGPSLLEFLEEVVVEEDTFQETRFAVQYVLRPHNTAHHDFRGLAGKISSGTYRVGDPVTVLPSMKTSRIAKIHTHDGYLQEASAPMSISILLEDDIDVGRGDLLVHSQKIPALTQNLEATLCWMGDAPMQVGKKYGLKHLTKSSRCIISSLEYCIDVSTFTSSTQATTLSLNEIGKVTLKSVAPLPFDPYRDSRSGGGFILIDEATNVTVASGMFHDVAVGWS